MSKFIYDKQNQIIGHNQYKLLTPCTEIIPSTFSTRQHYARYLMSSIPLSYSDNLLNYDVPAGLDLFYNQTELSQHGPYYVHKPTGTDDEIKILKLKQCTKLLCLDRVSNILILLGYAVQLQRQDIVDIINQAFPIEYNVATNGQYINFTNYLNNNHQQTKQLIEFVTETCKCQGFAYKANQYVSSSLWLL